MCLTSSYNVTKKSCQQLADMLICGLAAVFPDAGISARTVKANDGRELPAIELTMPGLNARPLLFMEKIFETYMEDGLTDEAVVAMVANGLRTFLRESHAAERLCQVAENWELAKELVYPVLMSKEASEDLGSGVIQSEYLDLTVTYRIVLGEACACVTDLLLSKWGISESELYEQALHNLHRDASLYEMYEDPDGSAFVPGIGMRRASVPLRRRTMYLAARGSFDALFGSGILLDRDFFRNISSGSGLYIIPSSVHELIVVLADGNDGVGKHDFAWMLHEVNREGTLVPGEVLSDTLYYYDPVRDVVRIA